MYYYFIDSIPPTVICPDNIIEDAVFGQGGSIVTWDNPQVFDDSGIDPTLLYQSHYPGDFFPSNQPTTVLYVYRDGAENEEICTFTVLINEGMAGKNFRSEVDVINLSAHQ